MSVRVIEGDCREAMAGMDVESVDAVVTDPPYDLIAKSRNGSGRSNEPDNPYGRHGSHGGGFMGLKWDATGVAFEPETWEAALRVLKPGAHLLAFGGTRTFHRMAVAIEDAGFEIRDCLSWLYGSGFPKSLDVSKAIDKVAGAEREIVGPDRGRLIGGKGGTSTNHGRGGVHYGVDAETAPATPLAQQWHGWGTALKPAWEPVIVARKPLIGTVAANVRRSGTGALNIDGCRIESGESWQGDERASASANEFGPGDEDGWQGNWTKRSESHTLGRWPANVVLDEESARQLDLSVEPSVSRVGKPRKSAQPGSGYGMKHTGAEYDDAGGPSRYFYCAKADRAERNAGLDGLWQAGVDKRFAATMGDGIGVREHNESEPSAWVRNHHPTVKPVDLMRWLVRLVTPKGGLVLDPFMGSGTTGVACVYEELSFVGIEQDAEDAEIARRRITHAQGPLFADLR